MIDDLTTLICLFHHQEAAQAAREDVLGAGVPEADVSLIARDEPGSTTSLSLLNGLDLPARDLHHLLNGLEHGDVLLTVRAAADAEAKVEAIFEFHQADFVSDSGTEAQEAGAAPRAAGSSADRESGTTVVPVLREEIQVGKRTVTGGARVSQRVVKVPVREQVSLRDANVRIERRPVDRAVSEEDSALGGEQVIELTETREELVVGKTARVVEEVVVGREVSEHVEHISDTLRHTEVEIEQIRPERGRSRRKRTVASSPV